ncbi:hypothetical protein BHE74_00037090, partial [Ensete ventricosum]
GSEQRRSKGGRGALGRGGCNDGREGAAVACSKGWQPRQLCQQRRRWQRPLKRRARLRSDRAGEDAAAVERRQRRRRDERGWRIRCCYWWQPLVVRWGSSDSRVRRLQWQRIYRRLARLHAGEEQRCDYMTTGVTAGKEALSCGKRRWWCTRKITSCIRTPLQRNKKVDEKEEPSQISSHRSYRLSADKERKPTHQEPWRVALMSTIGASKIEADNSKSDEEGGSQRKRRVVTKK